MLHLKLWGHHKTVICRSGSLPRRRSYGFVTQSFLSHERVGTRDEPLRTFAWEATEVETQRLFVILFFSNNILYYNLIKSCTKNLSKIFIKRKRQYQYKIAAKPLRNSKFQEITYSYKKNQMKSPSIWHKRQCADPNNTETFLIHEARLIWLLLFIFPTNFPIRRRN